MSAEKELQVYLPILRTEHRNKEGTVFHTAGSIPALHILRLSGFFSRFRPSADITLRSKLLFIFVVLIASLCGLADKLISPYPISNGLILSSSLFFAWPLSSKSKNVGSLIFSGTEYKNMKQPVPDLKFMDLLESAPDAFVIVNAEGKILMVNSQAEQMFGYLRTDLIDMELEMLIPERYRFRHIQNRQHFFDKPKVRPMGANLELFGKRKNGQEFPVEISLSPMKVPETNQVLSIAAIRDITRQKEIEARIRLLNETLEGQVKLRTNQLEKALQNEKSARQEIMQNQQKLSFLTKASTVINSSLNFQETLNNILRIIIPDVADWCAIDCPDEEGVPQRIAAAHTDSVKSQWVFDLAENNQPLSELHPFSPRVLQQPEWAPVIHPKELIGKGVSAKAKQLLLDLNPASALFLPMQNRDEFYGVIVLVRSGANKHYDQKDYEFARELIRRAALALENAKLYSQSQDINAELEKRVAFRTKELEASNNELESFSYSVSHDLRAPLRSIDGFSNRILKEYSHKLDDQGVDYFMRVKNASQKMGFLIDDLLKLAHFSRIEMNLVEINLSVMAESIAQELQSSEPDRKVVFKIEKDIVAKVDQVLFSVVFQNLIGNAWKYSRNQKKAIIEFGTLQKKGKPIYFIRDNGVGFDMNYVEKLFGAFQRLHSSKEFEGNGVGLATVQRIIRRHHGNIWTEGEVGKGATFYFSLPAE